MKIACLGDTHLLLDKPRGRKDDAHEVQKEKLLFVLDWARKNDAVIIQPGDFFDSARSWHLTVIYDAFLFDYFLRHRDVDIYVVYGQHDTYMYSSKTRHATGLGLLLANKLVYLLDGKATQLDNGRIRLYGVSFGQPVPKPARGDWLNVLVIHKMIVDEKLWAGQEDYVYAEDFLAEHDGYDLIVCGDLHRKFLFEQEGRYIVNSGALLRKEADAYNMTEASPGFWVFNTDGKYEDLEWVDIPHSPGLEVLSRDHIERQERIDGAMEELISGINDMKEEIDESESFRFVDVLNSILKENEIGKGVSDILAGIMDEEIRAI